MEVEGEQTNPENGTEEEGWSSSRMPSFAFSDPLSLGPGADEGSSSRGPVSVQEVSKCLLNKSVILYGERLLQVETSVVLHAAML